MSEISKPFLPQANQAAVNRNPEHWPTQVEGFLSCGYGGEKTRETEERKRAPDGSEHAPPHYCYQLSVAWCEKIDAHVADYFILLRGSFRDSALDKSAKNLTPKGGPDARSHLRTSVGQGRQTPPHGGVPRPADPGRAADPGPAAPGQAPADARTVAHHPLHAPGEVAGRGPVVGA